MLKVFIEFVTILLLFHVLYGFFFFFQDAFEVLAPTRDWICTPGSPEKSPQSLLILIWLTNTGAQGFGDLFLAPTWSSLLGRRHLLLMLQEMWCLPLLCSQDPFWLGEIHPSLGQLSGLDRMWYPGASIGIHWLVLRLWAPAVVKGSFPSGWSTHANERVT